MIWLQLIPALAATLHGSVSGLEPLDLTSTALVLRDTNSLTRERRLVTVDGTFEFYGLKPETQYVLSLDSDTLALAWSYVVVPHENDEWTIRKVPHGRSLEIKGPELSHPLDVMGYTRPQLVVDRQTFSLWKFLTQPTVLLSFGALALVTYLPTFLLSLDEETLKAIQENQIMPRS